MCGIVGAMTLGKLSERQEKLRQESMIFLTTELLQLTQARGTDATGVSILFTDGFYYGLKMGVSSPEFISRFGGKKEDFEGFIKLWRENDVPVKTYLGHCRKTSVGSAKDNANNHPIKVGNIVGIHNGTLTNHDVVFKKLGCKRDGDVDSEAIMRMLHFYTKKGTEPFTTNMLKEICLRIQGTYSVIAYNADNPGQVVTFRDGKPNVVALIKPLNLLLMSSEDNYIKQALYRYNKFGKLFLSKIKFPLIKKDDIEIKTMPDDTCVVFTLTDKLDKNTSINDIIETEKVLRADKLWKKGTMYNNQTQTHQTHKPVSNNHISGNKSVADNIGNKNNVVVHKDLNKDENIVKGKVWNKELSEFKDVDNNKQNAAKKIKSVELDTEGGVKFLSGDCTDEIEIEIVKAADDDDSTTLKEVPKEEVDNLVGNSAIIEDIPVKYSKKTNFIVNPSTGEEIKDKKSMVTVEVNANVNVEAMEAAMKAASVHPKFENDDEVLEELEIDDKKKLENLQLFALTNRLSKTIFKRGFYKGYIAGQKPVEKVMRAESSIKALKIMVKIFMKALRSTSHNEGWKKDYIIKALKEEKKPVTVEDIRKIFSAGDVRDNPELRYLEEECKK